MSLTANGEASSACASKSHRSVAALPSEATRPNYLVYIKVVEKQAI